MNVSRPLFSVIIPTFNRSQDLGRCLNSLRHQNFKNFEVIVCDDGSTDNTSEVIKSFEGELSLTYFRHDNWGGPAKPRNIGIKNSKAKWICFLDSDDWWLPSKLQECKMYIDDYDFIFHDVKKYNGEIQNNNVFDKFIQIQTFFSPERILYNGNFISCSSVCIKRSLFDNYLFEEDPSIIALEDYYAWIKLFSKKKVKVKHIKKTLSAYSYGFDNISSYNKAYIFKLFSLKRKVEAELGIDGSKSCISYLIGINLMLAGYSKFARKIFKYSFFHSASIFIKVKSLLRILR